MSFRSAVRAVRPALARVAPRAQAQAVPRRAASTQAGAGSSNTIWAMGSAAVFGPLLAYIMFSGPGHEAAHSIHENIDAKAAGQRAYVPASPSVPGAESGKKPSDLNAHSTPGQDRNPRTTGETKGDDAESSNDDSEPAAKSDSEGKSAGKSEDKSGDEPSKEAVKDSIKQAVAANAPLPAMDSEEKDSAPVKTASLGDAKKSDSGDKSDKAAEPKSEGDDEAKPTADAIKDSLHQAEKAAVPRAAMDDEAKQSHKQ